MDAEPMQNSWAKYGSLFIKMVAMQCNAKTGHLDIS